MAGLRRLSWLLLLIQAPSEERAVALARQTLAAELRVEEAELALSRVQPVEWPSDRLGCDEPGESDTLRPVSGYRVLWTAPDGVYAVHVSMGRAVVCAGPLRRIAVPVVGEREERGEEPVVEWPEQPELRKRLENAISDLATRLSVAPGVVELIGFRQVVWPDTSLGCPRPGLMYPQVLTGGYQARLRVGKQIYSYHGGSKGELFRCERPREPASPK